MKPLGAQASAPPSRGTPGDFHAGRAAGRPSGRRPSLVRVVLTLAVSAGLLAAGTAIGALLVREDVATTTTASAPDLKFLPGTEYSTINSLGFGTLTIGASQTSASLTVNGVPGAAWLGLSNFMRLQNTDPVNSYSVTMLESVVLNPAIVDFIITVKNGAATVVTWDAASPAWFAPTFTIGPSKTFDITITITIADGTATGSLGSFGWQFHCYAV